jgi:hypothetical protein
LARRANDRLHEAVRRHPDGFSAFAVLPTANRMPRPTNWNAQSPNFGFKGAMVNGMPAAPFTTKAVLADLGTGRRT